MIDNLLTAGLGAIFISAGLAEWGAPKKFWLPIMVGAVVILAYAGFTDVTAMSANS